MPGVQYSCICSFSLKCSGCHMEKSVFILTHFMSLISFNTSWKHQKIKHFLMFLGVSKETSAWNGLNKITKSNFKQIFTDYVSRINKIWNRSPISLNSCFYTSFQAVISKLVKLDNLKRMRNWLHESFYEFTKYVYNVV